MSVVVSVVMPMKNAQDYVYDAVQSILDQNFERFELIIVDDGSTDTSRKIVESFLDERVKVISGAETGAADAFNLALSIATGKYICNCDADDLFTPNRLSWQVEWLEMNEDYAAVCGAYTSMESNGDKLSQFNCGEFSEDISSELLAGITRTSFCTFLIKKTVLRELGGYRNYFVSAYDIDLQLRLATDYKTRYEPINSYFYRLHNSSITHTQGSNKRVFYENTAREFLMQRLNEGLDQLEKGEPPTPPSIDDQPSDSKVQIVGYLLGESWRLHNKGYKKKALNVSIRACMKMPTNWRVWKNLMMIVLK